MRPSDDSTQLDKRHQEVLRIVIQEHVRSGEPVSSRYAARLQSEGLSAATIRNIMSELTERGLLSQPHTSAGRVPTDKGYRYLVDKVLRGKRQAVPREAREIETLLRSSSEIKTVLADASKLLARVTSQVGVVLSPDLESALEHIEFVRIAPRRVVAIFVSRAGLVTHRVVDTDVDQSQESLDRQSARLRELYSGCSLSEARKLLMAALREDGQWVQRLGQKAVHALLSWLDTPFEGESGGDLFVEGTSHLIDFPEFSDVLRLREMMQTLEERTSLLMLLDRCLEGTGVQVIIGSEGPEPKLSPMSLIASPYHAGPTGRGLIGIVGPRRMEYARAVALVDHFARVISHALGESGKNLEDAG